MWSDSAFSREKNGMMDENPAQSRKDLGWETYLPFTIITQMPLFCRYRYRYLRDMPYERNEDAKAHPFLTASPHAHHMPPLCLRKLLISLIQNHCWDGRSGAKDQLGYISK